MKKKKIAVISIIIIVIAAIVIYAVCKKDVDDYHEKYEGYDLTSDVEGVSRENTYTEYLSQHESDALATQDIDLDVCDYTQGEDVKIMTDYEGEKEVLYTGDDSSVTWEVNVEKAGLYNVFLEYLTVESRGVNIERVLEINGELPFTGADTLTFSRLWTDSCEVRKDNRGNEIRPSQTESYAWQSAYCKDTMGYEVDPYRFYLKEGKNTITLKATTEPMVLRKLTLKAINERKTYEQYIQSSPEVTMSEEGKKFSEVIQGEDSTVRSDPSLYAKYDRSSPNTEPYSITKTVLNYIGGETWKTAGQWIQWDLTVPEDGYYNITIKGRQNYERGAVSCRSLYIDGEIPFQGLEKIEFGYNVKWDMNTLADSEGNPYRFYLTKGTHTIRLEVTLGDLGVILNQLQDSVYRMNKMYRKILVLTGATPDQYRDYDIDRVYPEVVEAMGLEAKRLYKLVDDFVAYSGQKSDKIATVQTTATQLERFNKKPQKIPKQFASFKEGVAAIGTSILQMSESKLDIDSIYITAADVKLPENHEGWAKRAWHEIKSFCASFIVDYNAVGDVYEDAKDDEVVTVWVLAGRDQSTILKSLVDDNFVSQTGIKVNIELIAVDALLNAVVAGNGPDVVITAANTTAVDYALRNAVEDLTQFDDLDEVLSQFYESAYEPYKYEGGVYALPETQNFNVMFYRSDVMDELGLDVPQTWEDLIGMLPTIQGKNMTVALPSTERKIANTANPDLSMFFSLVYQNDGKIYNDNNMKTVVDEEPGIKAFEDYTSYFNDFGLIKEIDFPTRFRSGECPIGIADYTTYNTLVVSAPEIKGLWDFTLMPGTEKQDAQGNTYIDRSNHCWGNCTMMIKMNSESRKKKAWEFMKWWVSTETQVEFGRELESLLGASARYATANKNAFEQLSWSSAQVDVLKEQWSWCVGFREIAGGYYTSQHLTNACRKVFNDKADPRETLLDYSRTINEEITRKRDEFDLPIE